MTDMDWRSPADRRCDGFIPKRGLPDPSGRGFPTYLRFVDLYGATVRVKASSLATCHAVWVFVDPAEENTTPTSTPSGIVHPAQKPVAVHMCRAMATELRDALDRFLAEPVDQELACETRLTRGVRSERGAS